MNRIGVALVFMIGVATSSSGASARTCDVTAFGAKGDGKTLDTRAIQAAVDACAAKGGGRVLLLGPGTYLSGTVILKDDVTLHVDAGAILLGSGDFKDYATIDSFVDGVGQTRGACLIGADGARNVGLSGKGTIDGQGQLWDRTHPDRARRPFLVRFVRCADVLLEDVRLTRSAAWTCNLYRCRRVRIEGLHIDSHVNSNNDGIDVDGCRNVRIRRCTISTGDDAICFKTTSLVPNEDVEVTDCDVSSRWGAFKWGTESLGDMRKFRISNCRIRDDAGGGFKILSADGAHISDIRISNVTLEAVDMPISIILKSRLRTYHGVPKRTVGSIQGVRIENVRGTAPDRGRVTPSAGILITGIPGHPVENVTLREVRLSLPGGGAASDADRVVPELEAEYPEYGRFGALPAFGAYIRHAVGVRLEDVRIEKRAPDMRHALVCDDVKDSLATDLGMEHDPGGRPLWDLRSCVMKILPQGK